MVFTSGGATPFKKNSANPKGGVKKDVCRLTASRIPIQTRSIPMDTKMGATTGTMMKTISMKSIKKPAMKTITITSAKKPYGPN